MSGIYVEFTPNGIFFNRVDFSTTTPTARRVGRVDVDNLDHWEDFRSYNGKSTRIQLEFDPTIRQTEVRTVTGRTMSSLEYSIQMITHQIMTHFDDVQRRERMERRLAMTEYVIDTLM
jgi:hypothetical protein